MFAGASSCAAAQLNVALPSSRAANHLFTLGIVISSTQCVF
ncbi:hypothetical protein FB99_37320 [Pantoea agglomerans]|nr:hypothetical protein FB99_37320 [Pantoea agglomerans]